MSEKANKLKQRLLTVLVLLPIGIFITYTSFFNGAIFALFVLLSQLITAFEIHQMAGNRSHNTHLWMTSFFSTLSLINYFLNGIGIFDNNLFRIVFYGLIGTFMILLLILESVHKDKENKSPNFDKAIENIGISLFAYVILGIFYPVVLLIKLRDPSGWLLTIMLAIVWMTDVGGLLFGTLFGKHPLKFLSSPRKTIEGYIGGGITALITGCVLYAIQQKWSSLGTSITLWQILILSVIISLSSMIGDLGESTFKRWAHSKDSGTIFPGHGGMFDRMDSALFSAPIFYTLILLMGY